MNFVFPEFRFNLTESNLARDTKAKEERAGFIKVHGQAELASQETLMLCEVLVKDKVRLDRNVKSVRSLVAGEVIPNYQTVVSVFHNEDNTKWRFTLVVREFTSSHKIYDKKPDSYTYVFGTGEKGRTASEQFYKLSQKPKKTLKDLEEAFSVEALSKRFFNEYKAVYKRFVDDIIQNPPRLAMFKSSDREKAARDFVKKMMGRIVFLYFLQKKGWLGCKTKWKDGDEQFMKTFVEKAEHNDLFYQNYLEPLFFDTLNDKRTKHNEDCIINKTNFGKVPYLNGGLFEKDEDHPKALTLSWENFKVFFDTLNNYNFTIIEDDPDFKEVAVDPEMLGHIFENLLEDNKDKGAFYTPKEIVHYMCQESLYEYLKTYLSNNNFWPSDDSEATSLESALYSFVTQKAAGKIIDLDKPLSKALKEVKICDPAIGSGAFPMGLLNEIFHCVHVLYDASPDVVGQTWGMRGWEPNNVKLNIIQNSIYGVDIERGAVDIARLRFWLSLIVDEPKPTALPNLDYKIIVGNSLVSKLGDDIVEVDWNANDTTHGLFGEELTEKKTKLLRLISAEQREIFNPESDKRKLGTDIHKLKVDLLINQLELMITLTNQDKEPKATSFTDKRNFVKATQNFHKVVGWKSQIKKLEVLKQKAGTHLDFFDWKLDFPEVLNPFLVSSKGGFDIVIGNPPYIQLQKMGKEADELESLNYETFARTGDIYSLFYELGFKILKENGVLAYITSNKWMRAAYGESLREFFTKRTNPIKLIDFGGFQVFETATVDTNILVSRNAPFENLINTCVLSKGFSLSKMSDYFRQNNSLSSFQPNSSWTVISAFEQTIKSKIESLGTPLKDWDVEIYRGILTGYNPAFIIDEKTRNALVKASPKSAEIIRPILKGRNIKKYKAEFDNLWIINSHNGLKRESIPRVDVVKDHPVIYKYLKGFEQDLVSRLDQGDHWTNLRNCAYLNKFEREKIIWLELSDIAKFAYDNEGILVEATAFFMTGESLKYLTAFLNSKLCEWYFDKITASTGAGTNRWKKIYLENVPIPKLTKLQEANFNTLVDKVLDNKRLNLPTEYLEDNINRLIYSLYAFDENEVKALAKTSFSH